MASAVDICNLALAHLGDAATVASIDPPEGSIQAEHCARFYPIARDSLLERNTWGFATKRVALALLADLTTSGQTEWDYVYQQPSDAVNIIAVLPPDAMDDYSDYYGAKHGYVPQQYSCELYNGKEAIYTDQEDAYLRYSALVSNPALFSPLFTETLSWKLASMLAGPVIKGDAGQAEAQRCLMVAENLLKQAIASDAGQRRIQPVHRAPWIAGR